MNPPFKGLSVRLATLILLAVTTSAGECIVHSISAKMYYQLNSTTLAMAAFAAVNAGAEYLPTDPRVAVQVAEACARLNGITPAEIIFTEVTPDRRTLKIRLSRKMPTLVALFAVGLPSRDIAVTASAQRRSDRHEAALQKISW